MTQTKKYPFAKEEKSILLRYIKSFEIENKATKIPNKKTSYQYKVSR